MVYGRLIYNNCKDYTPSWIKTLPYQQAVRPTFGIKSSNHAVRQPQVVSKFNADPKVKAAWKFLQRNVQVNPWVWQLLIFASITLINYVDAFAIFSVCYYPWLWVYQANNTHVYYSNYHRGPQSMPYRRRRNTRPLYLRRNDQYT